MNLNMFKNNTVHFSVKFRATMSKTRRVNDHCEVNWLQYTSSTYSKTGTITIML